jgi:hypothetical protein
LKGLFVILLATSSLSMADEVPCSDIATYDFKNSIISVKDGQALAAQASSPDALPFKNGACELKDDPKNEKPDWRYDMVGDFVMRPTRQAKLRVLRVYENNLSGTGSWDRVMAFQCKGMHVEKIWQHRFTQSIKLRRMNEIQFKVSSAIGKSKSKNSDFGIYQWDNKHGNFILRR